MRTQTFRYISVLLATLLLTPQAPLWATCGGGGGGGMGGMGGGPNEPSYQVPWKILKGNDAPPKDGLILYWFPISQIEIEKSSLRQSRLLSLYASQCVALEIAGTDNPTGQKLTGGGKLPMAVLAQPDDTVVGRVENKDGMLQVDRVEKMLDEEMKKRESAVKERLESGKSKAKSGDKDAAVTELRGVVAQKCMFPGKAKDAAKELKKLGVTDVGQIFDAPNFDPAVSAKMVRLMADGLAAENAARYPEAEKLYAEAHRLDPADPIPMRYLGEVYRHQLGDWTRARAVFNEILAMPADPMSRAVALHGLGKITIHEGSFKEGLALMERSVQEYPLALAYRNLAVYWNSEGDAQKTNYYVAKALELQPHDPFNVVFAAVFMAQNGKGDEALKIAKENESLMPASYNLAAIYAQMGQKEKALALLKRHFFEYERYQAVRSKEMMEARVDAVFASIKTDPQFVSMTAGADGMLDPAKAMSERR